jgi:UDP-glucuronate decarboxylase
MKTHLKLLYKGKRMAKILVTGGAGFIGSHLCKELLHRGDEVICLDNMFTGSKRNIERLFRYRNFEFIRHDVTEPILLEVDQIYNLACPASPVHYQHNPVKTIKTNVMGMINMLGIAKRVGARILQASTSEVYGDPTVHPQIEEYWGNVNPIGPRANYDEGKRVAETLCMEYHRGNNVDVRIIRIFNIYGPKLSINDGRVVSNFICQTLRGEPITIYGDGSQTRSFCYVSDLVEGMIAMMNQDKCIGPINLGNPTEYTMLQLADMVNIICNSDIPYKYYDLPPDDPIKRKPDISKAESLLNWHPTVPLRVGLTNTINYFRDYMNIPEYPR